MSGTVHRKNEVSIIQLDGSCLLHKWRYLDTEFSSLLPKDGRSTLLDMGAAMHADFTEELSIRNKNETATYHKVHRKEP